MAKNQSSKVAASEVKVAPWSVIVVSAVMVTIGLLVGYYLGRQSAAPPGIAAIQPENAAPLANPAEFAQDEAMLKAALRTSPNDLNSMIQLGNLYYDHNRFKDAVDWYGRALETDPNNVNVRTDRGTSYWNLGQADAAIAEFRRSLEVDPSHAQTLYNLGVVWLNGKNDPKEARKTWEKLLAMNPNYPERAKIQEQLASLPGGAVAPSPAQKKSASPGMDELLQRMKTRR